MHLSRGALIAAPAMTLRVRAALLCASCVLAFFVSEAAAQVLQVNRASFAGGIARNEAEPAYAAAQKVAPGSLWFWTEILVPESALTELRERKLLPLQHRWYRSYGGVPAMDGPPDFYRNLEEIDDRKIEGLAAEARMRGYFTYRTASCRQNIAQGSWVVTVTDASGSPIPCRDREVCRFNVFVSRSGVSTPNKCLGAP